MHTIVSFAARAALCATWLMCACARDSLPATNTTLDMSDEEAADVGQDTPQALSDAHSVDVEPVDVTPDDTGLVDADAVDVDPADAELVDIAPEPEDVREAEDLEVVDVVEDMIAPDVSPEPDVHEEQDMDTSPTCMPTLSFQGQVRMAADSPWRSPLAGDVGELLAFLPALPEGNVSSSTPVEHVLEDVVVIATDFRPQPLEFWVSDGERSIKVRLIESGEASYPRFDLRVGVHLSMRATELTNYAGVPTISGVDPNHWAARDNQEPVYIENRDGASLTPSDVNHLVRVGGLVLNLGEPCGGSFVCHQVGQPGMPSVTLRADPDIVRRGDCVTFVGPVSIFQGDVQLNVLNFSWLRASISP